MASEVVLASRSAWELMEKAFWIPQAGFVNLWLHTLSMEIAMAAGESFYPSEADLAAVTFNAPNDGILYRAAWRADFGRTAPTATMDILCAGRLSLFINSREVIDLSIPIRQDEYETGTKRSFHKYVYDDRVGLFYPIAEYQEVKLFVSGSNANDEDEQYVGVDLDLYIYYRPHKGR